MARIMILFSDPERLPGNARSAWVSSLGEELERCDGVQGVARSRVQAPTSDSAVHWDWLIEVDVDDDASAETVVRSRTCRELLLDLRLLGSAPRVMLTADGAR